MNAKSSLLKKIFTNEMYRCISTLSKCSSISQFASVNGSITSIFEKPIIASASYNCTLANSMILPNFLLARSISVYKINSPDPRKIFKNLKFRVHYPADGRYTVQPLKTIKLAGRDPETGRIIYRKIGGGHKQHFRWVDLHRSGPEEEDSFLEERVIHVQKDPIRSGYIALVGEENNLRYIMATENMKAGDIIKTTSHIYRNPVRPKEGDSYPIGSLPAGTPVNSLEKRPGEGSKFAMSAGNCAIVLKKEKDRVLVKLPSKRGILLHPKCMAAVGRVSNIGWNKVHVGSAQRRRWLGMRPASGLWKRKDGYSGRKLKKKPPPIKVPDFEPKPKYTIYKLNLSSEDRAKKQIPSVRIRRQG